MSEATYYPSVQHGMSRTSRDSDTESSKQDGDQRVSSVNRWRLLCGLAGSVGLLAGCSDLTGESSTETQQPATTESTTDDSTPTATPTADETTTQQTTATGGPELTTYENERYGYRIQYPAEWSVNENASRVKFASDSEESQLWIDIIDELGQNDTLDQFVDLAISKTRDRMSDTEVLDDYGVTLSSGQPAHVVEFRYSIDTGETVRSTYLATLHEERAYEVEFGYWDTNYTEAAEQLATSLIDSFALTEQGSPDQETDESSNETLDLSSLTTYTNDGVGYRIKYPEHWTIDDRYQFVVTISNPDRDVIRIAELEGSVDSEPLSERADQYVEELQPINGEPSSRQETALPSGQPAIALDLTYDLPNDEAGQLRAGVLFTRRQDTDYRVELVADASDWSSSVERGVERIITSFELTD